MIDTNIQIMVEVLTILGIATKEMKQGRISKYVSVCMSPVTEECPEKYGKRLIRRTSMEDALKRLDKLTHEESRMAIAENLRATHTVNERVRGVDDRITNVNDRVAEVIHGVKIIFSPEKRLTWATQMGGKQGKLWIKRPTM